MRLSARRSARPALLAAAAAFVAILASLAPAPSPAPAQAQSAAPPERLGLAYRFYVGGLLVGKATVTATFAEGGYRIVADAETTGAVGWFFEARFATIAEGLVTAGVGGGARLQGAAALAARRTLGVSPRLFEFDTLEGDRLQDMTMTYSEGAPAEVTAEPPFQERSYQLDPTRQLGTLDPLSAGIAAALQGDEVCAARFPIFDGRRRYDLILEGQVSERSEGGARLIDCAARWTRVGGFKPEHMARDDYEFRVRFEQRDGVMVPIRAWGSTEFGGAVAVIRR